ncbi:DUF362 domain-containing protein [Candidatus Sumerlaeota bacterium]|nr:DUF362 domain-containing protein [Candidatus Sumerlaeota bacterium]
MPSTNETAIVSLLRTARYENLEPVVRRLLELIDLPADFFEGKTTLLKVNLMKGVEPEKALNTHPEFVRAVVRVVREMGGEPAVGDSSGVLGLTATSFERSGIARVCREEKVRLLNFDACEPVEVPMPGLHKGRMFVPREALDADLFVTLPKLKTHQLNLITGAVKNQVGVQPGGCKCTIHIGAPQAPALARRVVEIDKKLRVALAILDAVWGIDSGASQGGRLREYGFVAASRDLVAIDSVAAQALGFDPARVATSRVGQEMGLGAMDPERIEVRGDPIESCLTTAIPAPPDKKRYPVLGSLVYSVRRSVVKPHVRPGDCRQCGECVRVCPTDAIDMRPYPVLNRRCVYCLVCYERCPERAYDLKPRRLLRKMYEKRARGVL